MNRSKGDKKSSTTTLLLEDSVGHEICCLFTDRAIIFSASMMQAKIPGVLAQIFLLLHKSEETFTVNISGASMSLPQQSTELFL